MGNMHTGKDFPGNSLEKWKPNQNKTVHVVIQYVENKRFFTMQEPMLLYICNDAFVQGKQLFICFSLGFIFFFHCHSVTTWLHKAVGFC